MSVVRTPAENPLLEKALGRVGRQDRQLAVLYFDLDGFKEVNDTWGHAVGDEVLRIVARRLTAAVRPGDTVARFGGDEYLVLCEGLDSHEEATEISRRLLESIAAPVVHGDGITGASARVGVVLAAQGASTPADLVYAADRAMYQAKHAGKAEPG